MTKQPETMTYRERLVAGLVRHREGSRKSKVHAAFEEKGKEEALKLAAKLGIKEGSAKRWVMDWSFAAKAAKPAKPAPKKRAAKKSAA